MDTQQSLFDALVPWTTDAPLVVVVQRLGPTGPTMRVQIPRAWCDTIAPGACLEITVGRHREFVYIVSLTGTDLPYPGAGSLAAIPAALRRVEGAALPSTVMRLAEWGARYYACTLGGFLAGVLPSAIREESHPAAHRRLVLAAGWDRLPLRRRQKTVMARLAADPDLSTGAGLTPAEIARRVRTTPATLDGLLTAGALCDQSNVPPGGDVMNGSATSAGHQPPTREQASVIAAMAQDPVRPRKPHLLMGVTGSGKTLVYLELAQQVIASGGTVLVLFPEIALAPQLAQRFADRFPRTVVVHSGCTAGERAAAYRSIAQGLVDVVVGTRSALFSPLPRLGLIIVDEEHDASFKQDSIPRYHARDLAIVYAQQLDVPIVLGSATPCAESWHHAATGKYHLHRLTQRPTGVVLPTVSLIDMTHPDRRQRLLSQELVAGVAAAKAVGQQSIFLLNRRGWSSRTLCRSCGAPVQCSACDIALVFHRDENRLSCHYCGFTRPLPQACPACHAPDLHQVGIGTEQLVEHLSIALPGLRILRMDADAVRSRGRKGHGDILSAFAAWQADCLVGTQMVAKGHDLPRVTFVGVVGADLGLSLPDFRAGERTFQILTQVAGRAGRRDQPGSVVMQTWNPQALPLTAAVRICKYIK